MALVSPGVEVTIIDESQYASARINTVPYILIATAENKVNASGSGIAPGTIASETNDAYLITSQRELVNTFGNPLFYTTSGGNSINGYELNEYGLMAAYSVLGATNRAYIQRADVDLASLTASAVRPTGNPNNGAYWLDLTETEWGVFGWNSTTNLFTVETPVLVIEDTGSSVPEETIGAIGDYAINTAYANNPIYFKNSSNEWVLIGSDAWKQSVPAIIGTQFEPFIDPGSEMRVNSTLITATGVTLQELIDVINAAVTDVIAAEVNGKLEMYATDGSGSGDSSIDVGIGIDEGGTGDDLLIAIGVTVGFYNGPIVQFSPHTQVPRWRSTDSTPRPTGSMWIKTTPVNQGVNLVVKRYDVVTDLFVEQPCPVYPNDETANKWLDPAFGGKGVEVGDTYAQSDVRENDTGTMKIFARSFGETSVTGTTVDDNSGPIYVPGHKYTVQVSEPNSTDLTVPVEVTLTGTQNVDFVTDLLGAGLPYLTSNVTANGRVNITHTGGGVIVLQDTGGGAIAAAGFSSDLLNVRDGIDTTGNPAALTPLILSNWNVLDYSADFSGPGQDPLDGTNWYYSAIDEMDIMISDDGIWKGYMNATNDIRGFDLSLTNSNGPMLSFIAPDAQETGAPLAYGDLWIDSSDLERYPLLHRWEQKNGVDQWVKIDTADSTSTNGLIFADARWSNNDTTDPITDDLVPIDVLNKNDHVDLDVPNPDLYPEGILLFNTRRSGYNVKEFRVNYFNHDDFDFSEPPGFESNAWVTVSGNKDDGRANMGRHAQRSLVTEAMKAAIDTSEDIREEQREFNLLAVPNYPELIPNMVALNNERKNTGFIVGDSPMRLPNSGGDLVDWATNNGGLGVDTGDGLVSNDEYLGVWYPSGKTNDLSGESIIVPPSHMMLRTILHSDAQSYPWLAPAGVRRGQVDNAVALGYIDAQTGEFIQTSIRQGVRDVLYQANVNPITFLPGSGITNYGNKTTKPGSALDRVNVARLINYIRKQLDVLAKPFLFEPNDEITRNEIKNVVESMLNDLVAKRGLYDYAVVCDKSNNTNFRIDRNELWVDIAVEPVKAVEFIYIPVRIKNTGEISGG